MQLSVLAGLAPRTVNEASNYLQASGVSIAYAGTGGDIVLAVDRVDLAVRRGELVCVVGPSGLRQDDAPERRRGLSADLVGRADAQAESRSTGPGRIAPWSFSSRGCCRGATSCTT